MEQVKFVGIDLAKNVFQISGRDTSGRVLIRKRLERGKLLEYMANFPKCVVGIEACCGSNYWGWKFFQMGHEVKQISPQHVKPYRRGDKNDSNDADAISEAAGRADIPIVPLKPAENRDIQSLHRIRTMLVERRTSTANQIRAFLLENGIIIKQGIRELKGRVIEITEDQSNGLTVAMREILRLLYEELLELNIKVKEWEKRIETIFKENPLCKKVKEEVRGIGLLTATALIASSEIVKSCRTGRQFSAALGLVPRQNSSGDKHRLQSISRRGDVYMRTLFVHGGRAFVLHASKKADPKSKWAQQKRVTRGFNKACVAVANKNAREAWAVMHRYWKQEAA